MKEQVITIEDLKKIVDDGKKSFDNSVVFQYEDVKHLLHWARLGIESVKKCVHKHFTIFENEHVLVQQCCYCGDFVVTDK